MNDDTKVLAVKLDHVVEELKFIREEMKQDRAEMHSKFVTKSELWPVKALVFGFASMIFVAFAGGLIGMVIK